AAGHSLGVCLDELLHGVGGLRAARDPVPEALLVDHDRRGLSLRVVVADRLDEPAIARRALVGDDHAPDRILLATHAGEANSYGHIDRERLATAGQLLQRRHLSA